MAWRCGQCQFEENPDSGKFCAQCGAPRPDAVEPAEAKQPAPPPAEPPAPSPPPQAPEAAVPPPPPQKPKSRKGLIIGIVVAVVLLCAVCLIGIIAAIAIPNFHNAVQRAKQKRAMGEVRTMATAVQSYMTDHNQAAPDTGHNKTSYYTTAEASALAKLLQPDYIKQVPSKDPWGHPYIYGVSPDDKEFIIICTGSDGVREIKQIPQQYTTTHCFQSDIVWQNDAFVQVPGGKQKNCSEAQVKQEP